MGVITIFKKQILLAVAAALLVCTSCGQQAPQASPQGSEPSEVSSPSSAAEPSAASSLIPEAPSEAASKQSGQDIVAVREDGSNLPIVRLDTENGAAIESKEEYIAGALSIDAQNAVGYKGLDLDSMPLKVKGRGNSSWNNFPKKSYRLKFDKKAQVLGLVANKDWLLVPSYTDKTLLRNIVAHEMAKTLDNLPFTPTHIPVDLFLNGEYVGVYTIVEKIEVGDGRIPGKASKTELDTTYLLEVGWDFDEELVYGQDYFNVEYVKTLDVKDPKFDKPYTPQYHFIKNYVTEAEKAIVAHEGYEKYLNVDSMVDWLILHEFTNNTESSFYRSCYLYKEQGGRLRMGPVWDFDMAFGSFSGDIPGYDGWAMTESDYQYLSTNWLHFFMDDPNFTALLKARWNKTKDTLLAAALDTIEYQRKVMDWSVKQNFELWDTLDKQVGDSWINPQKYNTYDLQVGYMVDFLNARYAWLDKAMNEF